MLPQPPEITTPADETRPGSGAPTRTRHSPQGTTGTRVVGRHRRVGAEPAEKFLLDIPTAHRPTTLADSPPYRAAFLTDDIPWSRPSPSDETPRYRASRAAENIPRQRTAQTPAGPPPVASLPEPPGDRASRDRTLADRAGTDRARTDRGPGDRGAAHRTPADRSTERAGDRPWAAGEPPRPRRTAAPGRRRAQQDTAWDKATGAVQRATTGLSRRTAAAPAHGHRARSIVVSPLPSGTAPFGDHLARPAGATLDRVLGDGRGRPVTGSRRAPGTLPIESWLLIGRHRQQALLAALVAVGITLVMIPTQQGPDEVTTVNAADRAVAAEAEGRAGGRNPGAAPQQETEAPRTDDRQKPVVVPPVDRSRPEPTRSASVAPPAAGAEAPAPPAAPQPGQTSSGAPSDGPGPAGSVRRTGSDVVALTFDDGPDPVETPKLLKLLADHQVKAMFCLVGERAQAHPELVRQIAAAGHTLCNHSWSHSFTLGAQPPEDIRKDLEATDRAIRDAVPDAPIPFFRAPGGIFTDRLVAVAGEYEMTSLYWEVDPRDWDHTGDADDAAHVERIVTQVKQEVRPGSIVLSHDFAQPQTVVAYEQLLPYLKEKFELGLP